MEAIFSKLAEATNKNTEKLSSIEKTVQKLAIHSVNVEKKQKEQEKQEDKQGKLLESIRTSLINSEKSKEKSRKEELQNRRRRSADPQLKNPAKELAEVFKKDKNKKGGIFGDLLGGLFGGLASLTTGGLLKALGLTAIGGLIAAYIASPEFKQLVDDKIISPIGNAIKSGLDSMFKSIINSAGNWFNDTVESATNYLPDGLQFQNPTDNVSEQTKLTREDTSRVKDTYAYLIDEFVMNPKKFGDTKEQQEAARKILLKQAEAAKALDDHTEVLSNLTAQRKREQLKLEDLNVELIKQEKALKKYKAWGDTADAKIAEQNIKNLNKRIEQQSKVVSDYDTNIGINDKRVKDLLSSSVGKELLKTLKEDRNLRGLASPQMSKGGWITGPQSGYPVSLTGKGIDFIGHGTEYVVQRSSGGFVIPVDTPHTKSDPSLIGRRIQEAKLRGFSAGGEVTHPHTGTGYNPGGATDAQGRPVVLSKDAAESFYKLLTEAPVWGKDVTSSQRSAAHNKKVGGVANSNHLYGNAIDIHGKSKAWLKKNGHKYGWQWLDYGGHDGHFDYVGGTSKSNVDVPMERDETKGSDGQNNRDGENNAGIFDFLKMFGGVGQFFAGFAKGLGLPGSGGGGSNDITGGTNPGGDISVKSEPLTGDKLASAKKMIDYIVSKGYTANQAKGIVANIQRESSFDPFVRSGDDGGPGGLFQWKGSRQTATVAELVNSGNWKGQIDYALEEDVGPQYKSATAGMSAYDASMWWAEKWERPASLQNAINKHKSFLPSYDGLSMGGPIVQPEMKYISGGPLNNDAFRLANNASQGHKVMTMISQPVIIAGGGGQQTPTPQHSPEVPLLPSNPGNSFASSLIMTRNLLSDSIGG